MEELTLPQFDIPADLARSAMSADEYVRWLEANWRLLRQNGKLDALYDASGRGPVNARFTLSRPKA